MRTLWLLVLCGFLGVQGVYGQQAPRSIVLSGRVTAAETGEPLVGATLYALSSRKGTATDSTGAYSLTLPAGPVTLRVSYLGYRLRMLTLDLEADRTLDIALVPRPLALDEVEVTADREEDAIESTQMGTIDLSVAELEKLPALLGEVDVLKAIQLLPGVQSGTEGTTGLYVRGGGPDQNLILLDGVPVYNPNHVFGFLSVFNSDALEDVRLVKGGFPARYGGRLSSVVDVTMKEGSREQYRTEGSLGLVASSITAEGPILKDKVSFIASARRTYIDVLAQPFIQSQMPEGQGLTAYFYDLNAKLSYVPSDADRFSLSLYGGSDVYSSRDENAYREGGETVRRERYEAGADWGNLTGALRWKHLFSNKLSVSATLLYSRYRFGISTRLTQIDESRSPAETFEEVTYTSGIEDLGAKIDFDYRPLPDHYVRFGGSVVRHAFNPGVANLQLQLGGEGDLDTTLTPSRYHFSGLEGYLYAEDDVRLTGRLKANLGLHASALQVEGRTYTSLQPRLSLRYLLRPNWSVKASFASMEQYLHLLTNTGINLPTDLWLAATDRIGPQQAWQAALGAAFSFGDGAFEASLEGYYRDMRGLIEYEPGASFVTPNEDWQDKVVTGHGWAYGVEVFLRKDSGRTTGWVGYTLAWSRRQFDALNSGAPFPYRYDRRHDLSLVVSHKLSERLDVSASWVYGTGQAVTLASARFLDGRFDPRLLGSSSSFQPELRTYGPRGGYRMAPYHRLDVALNWHFKGAFFLKAGESTLTLGAYNTYNRKNPFYLFVARDRNGNRIYKQASLFPILPAISYRFHF